MDIGSTGDRRTRRRIIITAVASATLMAAGLSLPAAATASVATVVTAGGRHTCAVAADGSMRCWGWNPFGGLGDGTTIDRPAPVAVIGLSGAVVAESAGPYHTCAVTTAGAVQCWGGNQYGQLGDGTTTHRLAPVTVVGLESGVAAVAASFYHTCALTEGGAVLCWGANFGGRLGDGTTTESHTPVAVSGLGSGVVALRAGVHHTCAVTDAGAALCWGGNFAGQLGDGTEIDRSTPTPVSGLGSGVAAVATGYYHTCAATTGGAVLCWGAYGEAGDGTTFPSYGRAPVPVPGLGSGVTGFAAGRTHTCALTGSGALLCWGGNAHGQLGDGTTTDRLAPTPVAGLQSGVLAATAGEWHTCALTTGGAVSCWGDGEYGALGDGTTGDRNTPVAVTPFDGSGPGVTAISPASGPGSAGTDVVITGTGFAPGATVTIGLVPASRVTVVSATTITATTPWHAAGVADVVVTNLDGAGGMLARGFTFTSPRRYFAEGATIPPFDCQFALANPTATDAPVTLRFLTIDREVFTHALTVPAMGRRTVDAKSIPGLEAAQFSTAVESEIPIVADRTMRWGPNLNAAHTETSITAPSTIWYLAEGATHSNFDLFYTIQNPQASPATIVVRYLRPSGRPPLDKQYEVAGNSRVNIWVDYEQFPEGSGERTLQDTDVSARITSDVPVIVERSMYLSSAGQQYRAGHSSAGVTAPATSWSMAEGATGNFFDLFILVANPNPTDAVVRATYLLNDGSTLTKQYTVLANSRFNIWVDYEQFPEGSGNLQLADAAVSTTLTSLNDVPVIVERAMWWPGPTPATWAEAHNSPASTGTGTLWAVADGEQGGVRNVQTYLTIANTSATVGQATVTLRFEDGSPAVATTVTLPANSRTNVHPPMDFAASFPAGVNRLFWATVESVGTPAAQIVVERSMYWDANGEWWAAGTNALATRIR